MTEGERRALTEEEEASIRDRMDIWSDYGPDPSDTIRRLLATLDAERAARAEPGVREAAHQVVLWFTPEMVSEFGKPHGSVNRHIWPVQMEALRRLRVVLGWSDPDITPEQAVAALEAHGEPQEGEPETRDDEDREAELVAKMAHQMTKELTANQHKKPWTELTADYLLSELRGHVDKLAGDGSWEHAADVANLAGMVADQWTEPLATVGQPEPFDSDAFRNALETDTAALRGSE